MINDAGHAAAGGRGQIGHVFVDEKYGLLVDVFNGTRLIARGLTAAQVIDIADDMPDCDPPRFFGVQEAGKRAVGR